MKRRLIALWLSMILMSLSLILKIYGGITFNSTSLLADGFDSMINLFSMSIAIYLTYYSTRPADEKHPYGHYGFTALSTMVTGIIMITVGTLILLESYNGLIHRELIEGKAFYYSIFSTIILTSSVILYSKSIVQSMAIKAEVRHLLTDIAESIVVLIGVYLSINAYPIIDKILAIGIGLLFYYGGIKSLNEVKQTIVYETPNKETLEKLSECLEREKVKIKRIRIRRLGDKLYADAIIELDPKLTLEEAHKITDSLEEKASECMNDIVEIIIHPEPYKETIEHKKL